MNRKTLALAGALLVAAALAAGCNDDDGNGGQADTGSPGAPAATAPLPTRTPPPVPTEGGEVDSGDLGYTASVPEGWAAQAPNAPAGTLADLYVGPGGTGIPPTILVRCATGPAPDAVQASLTAVAAIDPAATVGEPTVVAGVPATTVTYTAGSAQTAFRVSKRDVLFSDGRCAWTITLTAGEGMLAQYEPAFTAFLASFRTEG